MKSLLFMATAAMTGCALLPHVENRYLITRANSTAIAEITLPDQQRCLDMLSTMRKVETAVSTCENRSANLEYTASFVSKSSGGEIITSSSRTMAGCQYFTKYFSTSGYVVQQTCRKNIPPPKTSGDSKSSSSSIRKPM
jgi:hypothetical protein